MTTLPNEHLSDSAGAPACGQPPPSPGSRAVAPLRIAISGSSGLIGSSLREFLERAGHVVHPLVRRVPQRGIGEIAWDPAAGRIDARALEGLDAVVHLAGERIAHRWTRRRKAAILNSRVDGTRLLSRALQRLTHPPKVFVSASAVGFYGDRGEEILTDESASGTGFLAEVCRQWELAAQPESCGSDREAVSQRSGMVPVSNASPPTGRRPVAPTRLVLLRLGLVLSARGGALPPMLRLFRLGLGGPVGGGRQYLSWISLADLLRAVHFLIVTDGVCGPVNAVAPGPVTNAEFARALGRRLHRPALLPVPGFAVRLILGEMGQGLLLNSARVLPAKLRQAGFTFLHAHIEDALRGEVGGGSSTGPLPPRNCGTAVRRDRDDSERRRSVR